MMKRILLLIILLLLLAGKTQAKTCNGASPTWTAATASAADVQACFNKKLHCDDTIIIPAGDSIWNQSVDFTPPTLCAANHGATVQGQTTCDGIPGVAVTRCTDRTNITFGANGAFHANGSNTGLAIVTGMTFIIGTGHYAPNCPIGVGGAHVKSVTDFTTTM
jgi:hypothetical protein